jgi:predicted Rossmann fold flavoprotein
MQSFDVIVIGGGAAGLMCASAAGQRGHRVIVLESSNKIGKKILMSGGGRCNFTNLHCKPEHFVSANPRFCISALSRYSPGDFVALVERHGIPYHEKAHGQLFCNQSSKDILGMLQAECTAANVVIKTHCSIEAVRCDQDYVVESNQGDFTAAAVVVATGGLSIPKMGASDFGYRVARQFGLQVRPTRAGLVPFTFTGSMHELADRLAGVSALATVQTATTAFTEDILFTHRGLSGPAALQASSYWKPGQDLCVNLFPGKDLASALLRVKTTSSQATLRTLLAEHLPRSLVVELQALFWPDIPDQRIGDWSDAKLRAVAQNLENWLIRPAATEGYRTAEVTLGGVDTDELSSKTMECKRQAGLFFIGEVVDVTGQLGGFNFQWAWASAQAAGQAI